MKSYDVVKVFEREVAKWAGAKYGIAVESCCAAIFLCLKYLNPKWCSCPIRTYPGVAMAIKNAGSELVWDKDLWEKRYYLNPTNIVDSALCFEKNMYLKNTLYCLSFHSRKLLPIGRGGMVLTDDKDAYNWLKMARFDGRKELPLSKDNAVICGWNMYLTPEQAARGLVLFDLVKKRNPECLDAKEQGYPNLTKWRCFNG